MRTEEHVAAYGVLDKLADAGRALSYALFTSTSICVGTWLGAADPARSKQAAKAGIQYSCLLGLLIATALLSAPEAVGAWLCHCLDSIPLADDAH